ncbi:hybrid sensor histidine kinase/response regulator [Paraglaciecola polaris]|uniref:hybrid sensor histidine kinase/response regulator n=1 Tax=Paraglaciecola polaris TaxID=222814 RepID=UPI00058C880A|nr:hybrid sensor histidine kinase/response regulator [Paraglaciecola polaris]
MFKTLKFQILLVSVILILLLVSQVFVTRGNQSSFVNSLDLTQQAVIKVSLVRELERDVLDLQRNVLIYKDSASKSAIARFNSLIQSSMDNLITLETLTSSEEQIDVYHGFISRMRSHIAEYQDNFSNVIAGRSKRDTLFNERLAADINAILDTLSKSSSSSTLNISNAKYHITRAENVTYQYLLKPDYQLVERFRNELNQAKTQLSQTSASSQAFSSVITKLDEIDGEFLQLTNVTSGYLFLVNVVMAGSANEFLFMARELNLLVTSKLGETNEQVKKNIEKNQLSSDLFSIIGILLACSTAYFLASRIMLPINTITEVFKKLAKGEDVDVIPGITQHNEIGQLADAADVFHEKNKQTTALLAQAQRLNAKQEILNAELVESKYKAEQATQSKSMFLANMSHEIRTPMNGIIGLLDVVMKSNLTSTQRQHLNKVVYSSQILMSLINDILDFSKVEAGKLDIEQVEFSLNSVFANLLTNISVKAQEKNLNVRFICDPDIPPTLIGDPLRISQVLLNLSSNAVKFTRNGSVTISITYDVLPNSNKLRLRARVQDTGIGMSEEQLDKVFESFTQADGTTSRDFGGTGLGLTIVKQLVNLMGGEVTAESEVNVGSIFNVSFTLISQSKEQHIFAIPPQLKRQLYYFSKTPKGLIKQQYFANIKLEFHHFPHMQLEKLLDEISERDIVIIDIADQSEHQAIAPSLQKLKDNDRNVGFITDTQPSNLPQKLINSWSYACLTHPFTPGQLTSFIHSLLNEEKYISDIPSPEFTEQLEYDGHVLLVEDNSINQVVTGEMLRVLGITFDIAEDGQQAVTKVINSAHYDVVLMDIQMPVMDGYEATKEIRHLGLLDLVICGLSANAMKEDFVQAKEVGMNEYLTKPLKLISLEEMLSKYLPAKVANKQ